MDTSAVTDSTSAVDEAVTGFLPTDEHYRLTGELKDVPKEDPKPSLEEASAASESETAAASEAATDAEEVKGPAQTKTADTSESRWAKLSRENRELREKMARLEGRAEATVPEKRETKQDSQPVTETKAAKPTPGDVDPKTGKPKYPTWDDYEDARDAWRDEQLLAKFNETASKSQREQQVAQAEQVVAKGFQERVSKAREKYADYDTVAFPKDAQGNDTLHLPKGSLPDLFILKSPHGVDVLYELGKHPEILATQLVGDKLQYKMDAIDMARELVKIETKFSAEPDKPSAKPVTQAPRPPHQTSGKGTVAKDSVEQAVEDQDQDTYNREQNARDLARLSKRK